MRTGIFVGSFDPFTIGHKSVVDRVLPLFDRVVIGVGVNERKQYMLTTDERVDAIRQLYAGDERVVVESYSDLTVDFAQRHDAQFVVKGVRNVRDFEYERDQADINRRLRRSSSMPSQVSTACRHRWCASLTISARTRQCLCLKDEKTKRRL